MPLVEIAVLKKSKKNLLDAAARTRQKAWMIFGVLSLPYLLVYFHRVAPAVMADKLMADFQLSGALLGNLAAIYFYVYTVMQLPSGVLSDTLGGRKTVFAGMLISGVGTIVFSLASVLWAAYLGRFCIGLGVSVVFVSILKIISEWFHESRFGMMSGITVLIGNTGAILAATPLALAVSMWGWRPSFMYVGMISIFAAIITLILVKDRPSDAGLPAPNGPMPSSKKANIQSVHYALTRVGSNPLSWPPFVVFFGIYGSLMAFQGVWGIPYLVQHYGMTRVRAASTLLAIAIGLAAGSPVVGAVSDLIKRRKLPLILCTLCYIFTWLPLLFWPGGKPSAGFLPVLFFIMGFSASGFILIWAYAKEVNSRSVSGSAMGLVNMGGILGAATLQPLLGWALDSRWGGLMEGGARYYPLAAYHFAFKIALIVLFVSWLFVFLMRESYGMLPKENDGKEK